MILHVLAVLAVLTVARIVFLRFAPAMRRCTWCGPGSRWCLRCGRRGRHFRLGTRTVHAASQALSEAIRDLFAGEGEDEL